MTGKRPKKTAVQGYQMCNKFWTPFLVNISMQFQVQNLFGQI